jgi:DNA polymerase V
VLALLDGEFTVKRYRRKRDQVVLVPENPAFAPITVTAERAFEVWGVVTGVVRVF